MLKVLKRFLANEDGYMVAQDWAILASILLLGSVLALLAAPQPEDPVVLPPVPAQVAPAELPPPDAPTPGT
jgi:hypothetical protein